MKIKCDGCSIKIKRPGALLFGPPVPHNNNGCKKWHLCLACYLEVTGFMKFKLGQE